jgi:serine/threonine protein kinase
VHVAAARGLTTDGIVLGTADYISPEQAQGLELGPTTDIYSLGVVLFEMLSGVLPFTGTTSLVVAMQHATRPPPPLRSIAPEISRNVERLVHRALAKEPERRFQSAHEMSLTLRSARAALLPRPVEFQQPYDRAVEEALNVMDWRGMAERLRQSAEVSRPSYEVVGKRRSRGSSVDSLVNTDMAAGVDSTAVWAGHRSQEIPTLLILILVSLLMLLLLCIVFLHSLG